MVRINRPLSIPKSLNIILTKSYSFFTGVQPRFTYWGIISGLFWVPGATAGIYGIRNAGLAISVGVWSALIVISSFGWGIFVFNEKVKSIQGALIGALILMIGLVGMAIYSAPVKKKKAVDEIDHLTVPLKESITESDSLDDEQDGIEMNGLDDSERCKSGGLIARRKRNEITSMSRKFGSKSALDDLQREPELLVFCGGRLTITKRTAGIIGAAINGFWGSNNMIPMHYARYVFQLCNVATHGT